MNWPYNKLSQELIPVNTTFYFLFKLEVNSNKFPFLCFSGL